MLLESLAAPTRPSEKTSVHPPLSIGVDLLLRRAWLGMVFCVMLVTAIPRAWGQGPSTVGQWTPVSSWPYIATHISLLPNGKVLWWPSWAAGDNPTLWDPVSGTQTAVSHVGYNIFCTGHSFLGDGRLLVSGGHVASGFGLPYASLYDPSNDSWSSLPAMSDARWYPTNITLANGDELVVSGEVNSTIGHNPLSQVWQVSSNSWRNLTTAQLLLPLYPEMFVAPDGRVFYAGPTRQSRYLNTGGTGAWSIGPVSNYGTRDYGPAVMYDSGKILLAGGGDPPTATAEVINLNDSFPAWRYTAPMTHARRQSNATLLPDGTVLVTGGSGGPGFDNSSAPVYPAELWNPTTESWQTLASLSVYRGYHSIALLLPDGRVLSAGGNVASAEIFSPPYLFKGTRPNISSAPARIRRAQTFFVGTANPGSIAKVSLVRIGSVTHSFNANQRISFLKFSQASGGLYVTVTQNANLAPVGHYMLFLLDGNGVPSVAKILHLR